MDFIGWGGKAVRAFARMPTHAVTLHEWGTQGCGLVLCMGHPPRMPTHAVRLHEWGTQGCGWFLCMGHPPPPPKALGAFDAWTARHPQTCSYNRLMVFCVYFVPSWLSHLAHWVTPDLYDKTTFLVVVAIGIFQTLVAWESGYLAVVALPKEEATAKRRKKHKIFFIFLAVSLFFLTFVVGVLNDRSQRKEEGRAEDEKGRADRLQATLEDTQRVVAASKVGVAAATDTARRGGSPAEIVQQLEHIQQALLRASNPQSSQTAPSPATSSPLSAMSNAQLKTAAMRFAHDLHSHSLRVYDAMDAVTSARRYVDAVQNLGEKQVQEANRQLAEKVKILNDASDIMVQQDVPLANLYRSELLRRLKLAEDSTNEFTAVKETDPPLNQFVTVAMTKLDDWARALPPN